MAVSLKHTTQAAGTDAGNGEIRKAQWNEEHTLSLATGKLLGRSTAGTGVAEEITPGTGLAIASSNLNISTVPVANGGTGLTTYTTGDLIAASASGVLASVADIATGNVLLSGGVGTLPSYGKVGLTTHINGTLPIANGGTGATTGAGAFANAMGYTTTATITGVTVLDNTSTPYQVFTGILSQTITLPNTSTLTPGWTFRIVSNTSGSLTINSSTGALVATVKSQATAAVTCISTSVSDATAWEFGFSDFGSTTGAGAVVQSTGPTITGATLNGTLGATTPSTGAFTTVAASTSILTSGANGLGFSTGAGVAVTQLTSRVTSVSTSGKQCGSITLFSAAPVVGTYASFVVNCATIAATDTVILNVRGATNLYQAFVSAISSGVSFTVTIVSVFGTAIDSPIINYAIIKAVAA